MGILKKNFRVSPNNQTIFMKIIVIVSLFLLTACQTVIVPNYEIRQNLKTNLNQQELPKSPSIPEKLTLKIAKKIAIKENPGLQAAGDRILRAQAVLDQAKSLYFPTLTAGARARHHNKVSEGQFSFPTSSFENYTTNLSAQWLIFDGFVREYKVLAAQYGTIATEESYKDAQRLLLDSVSQTFYRIILAEQQMKINLELKSINQKFLEDAKVKLDAGTSTRAEVNNFKVNVNDAQIAYLESKDSFDTAKVILAELLGSPNVDTDSFSLSFSNEKIIVPSFAEAMKKALSNRPDLKVIQSEILAAEAQLKEAEGEYYPKFFLEGSYGTSSFDSISIANKDRDSFIGASMSWDLFTGNSTAALMAQRIAEKNEKLKNLKTKWFDIISKIRQQRQSLLNVLEKEKLQASSAELTKSIYEDTKQIYENGVTTVTRVNEVLVNYSIANLNKVLFEIEAMRRKEVLNYLMGINYK